MEGLGGEGGGMGEIKTKRKEEKIPKEIQRQKRVNLRGKKRVVKCQRDNKF